MAPDQLHDLAVAFAAYLIAAASPGPSNMAIMGMAMRQGRAAAVTLALGVMTGSMVWALAAATGLAALMTRFAGALVAVKIAGGLYLIWLAWKSARAALAAGSAPVRAASAASTAALWRRGALLHLGNPKSVLGWVAVLSLGLGPDAPAGTVLVLVGGCAFLGVCVFVGYALAFSAPTMARAYGRARRWIEGTLALVFGSAGLRLLASRL